MCWDFCLSRSEQCGCFFIWRGRMTVITILAVIVLLSSVSVLTHAIKELERSKDVLSFVLDVLEHGDDKH